MQPPEDIFDDPMLMQQLLGIPAPQQEPQMDQSSPTDREGSRKEAWSMALILSGIFLILAWVAVPLGAFGAWFYGPIEGFFASPTYSRFEAMTCGGFFIVIGMTITFIYINSKPKLHWVENEPGIPRISLLKSIEETGGAFLMERNDGKLMRVRKDIASRYRNIVHITAHVLEVDGREPGIDIEFRTTSASMSRSQIAAEEDLSMRQGFREQQLEYISQRYVSGQMDQIDGVG